MAYVSDICPKLQLFQNIVCFWVTTVQIKKLDHTQMP